MARASALVYVREITLSEGRKKILFSKSHARGRDVPTLYSGEHAGLVSQRSPVRYDLPAGDI